MHAWYPNLDIFLPSVAFNETIIGRTKYILVGCSLSFDRTDRLTILTGNRSSLKGPSCRSVVCRIVARTTNGHRRTVQVNHRNAFRSAFSRRESGSRWGRFRWNGCVTRSMRDNKHTRSRKRLESRHGHCPTCVGRSKHLVTRRARSRPVDARRRSRSDVRACRSRRRYRRHQIGSASVSSRRHSRVKRLRHQLIVTCDNYFVKNCPIANFGNCYNTNFVRDAVTIKISTIFIHNLVFAE